MAHGATASQKDAADYGAFVARLEIPASGSGPLNGLTFAVKDLIDVAGTRTGGGNPDWLAAQRPAQLSAPVVTALLAAGARLVGKTVTDELAFSLEGVNAHHGTPINPACPDRIPGGSSSGSAVAVAAGLVDFALGTDTGGSVRVPASFTGVLAMRPSHGAIALDGVVPFAPSYDTIGWFARDLATLEAVADVLLPKAEPPRITRLCVVSDAFALADPSVASVLRQCCDALGVDADVTLFDGADDQWLECYRVLQGAEIWRELGPWIETARPRFGDAIAPRFDDAATISASDVARWQPMRAHFAAKVRALLGDGVALLMPTAPCVALCKSAQAPEISEFYRRALALTSVAGHAGLPQMTVPAGEVGGCPVGLSVIASIGHDRALFEVARRCANVCERAPS